MLEIARRLRLRKEAFVIIHTPQCAPEPGIACLHIQTNSANNLRHPLPTAGEHACRYGSGIMRKLKLETLQVESFETTSTGRTSRGTIEGHDAVAPDTRRCGDTGPSYCHVCYETDTCEPETYDVQLCIDTNYFDCTL